MVKNQDTRHVVDTCGQTKMVKNQDARHETYACADSCRYVRLGLGCVQQQAVTVAAAGMHVNACIVG